MLSSETEQMTQGSFGFQEKSEIFAVWPPWINYVHKHNVKPLLRKQKSKKFGRTSSSGGPSSASSVDCSSPILDKSQTCRRRSVPEEAKIVSLCGDHWTWKISSLCDSNECNLSFRFLKSQRATVWKWIEMLILWKLLVWFISHEMHTLSAEPVAKMNSE